MGQLIATAVLGMFVMVACSSGQATVKPAQDLIQTSSPTVAPEEITELDLLREELKEIMREMRQLQSERTDSIIQEEISNGIRREVRTLFDDFSPFFRTGAFELFRQSQEVHDAECADPILHLELSLLQLKMSIVQDGWPLESNAHLLECG